MDERLNIKKNRISLVYEIYFNKKLIGSFERNQQGEFVNVKVFWNSLYENLEFNSRSRSALAQKIFEEYQALQKKYTIKKEKNFFQKIFGKINKF